MEREFLRVLSTSPMLEEDSQRRNLCELEWLNIDATGKHNLTSKPKTFRFFNVDLS